MIAPQGEFPERARSDASGSVVRIMRNKHKRSKKSIQFQHIWYYDFNAEYGIITLVSYYDEAMQGGEWL